MIHKDLMIWKSSFQLTIEIYKLTKDFPKEEMYGLKSQMCRAAVSVPSNIAEGAARQSSREFMRFLRISQGSLSELETQYEIAVELGYTEKNEEIISTIKKIRTGISKLIKSIEGKLVMK